MKKILIFLLLLIVVSGCMDKDSIMLKYKCNGVTKKISINSNSVLKCNMFGAAYEFHVISIENGTIKMESNLPISYVTNNSIDVNSTMKNFELHYGLTEIAIPTEDIIQEVTFEW